MVKHPFSVSVVVLVVVVVGKHQTHYQSHQCLWVADTNSQCCCWVNTCPSTTTVSVIAALLFSPVFNCQLVSTTILSVTLSFRCLLVRQESSLWIDHHHDAWWWELG